MYSANDEKIVDLKCELPRHQTSLKDKSSLQSKTAVDEKARKMALLQHTLFSLIVLTLLIFSLVSAASHNRGGYENYGSALAVEKLKFQELLNSLDPNSLHEVLHDHLKDKYQHGIYQEDKDAIEAIHDLNAAVGRSLIELAKRQSSNQTTTTTIISATTTDTVTSTSIPTSTTSVVDSTPTSTPSTSAVPPTPTSSTAPAAPTSSTSAAPAQSTSSLPSSTLSTSVIVPTSSTTGASGSSSSSQATSAPSSTPPATTSIPGSSGSSGSSSQPTSSGGSSTASSSSKAILYTTTEPNGDIVTVTSYTIVPGEAEQTSVTSPSSTNTGKASLQTGGSSQSDAKLNAAVGALALLVAGCI